MDLPQPTALALPREEIKRAFTRYTLTRCTDARWHFAIGLRQGWRLGPGGEDAPSEAAPLTPLALFKQHDPEVDLEVLGYLMPREIDPADWLLASLEKDGKSIVSSKPVPILAGVVGDCVATWELDGEAFAGRFVTSKWGPRLYVMCLRTRAEHYPRFADDFFVSVATFECLDDSLGLFAEPVTRIEQARPRPWKMVLPESWLVELEPEVDPQVSSLQARLEPESGDYRDFAGHLSLAVVGRGKARRARDVGDRFLAAVRDTGIAVARDDFEEEPPPKRFAKAWGLVSPAAHAGAVGEVRCRVVFHEDAWAACGVVSPTRADNPLAWMQCKRALDIATGTLELV